MDGRVHRKQKVLHMNGALNLNFMLNFFLKVNNNGLIVIWMHAKDCTTPCYIRKSCVTCIYNNIYAVYAVVGQIRGTQYDNTMQTNEE